MIFYITQNGDTNYGVVELAVDKVTDIKNIPNSCAPGSSCVVIEDFSIWMLGSDGWHQIGQGDK